MRVEAAVWLPQSLHPRSRPGAHDHRGQRTFHIGDPSGPFTQSVCARPFGSPLCIVGSRLEGHIRKERLGSEASWQEIRRNADHHERPEPRPPPKAQKSMQAEARRKPVASDHGRDHRQDYPCSGSIPGCSPQPRHTASERLRNLLTETAEARPLTNTPRHT